MLKIKQKVSELLETALEYEPFITKDLLEIAKENNGELVGLENRFKTESSLFRKLSERLELQDASSFRFAEILDDFAANINDVLRYTMIFRIETYTSDCLKTLQILEQKSYKIEKIWNAWLMKETRLDLGYRGLNTIITNPPYVTFELQFHTFESYTAKEANHFLYEEMRLKKTDKAKRKLLRKTQINNVADLKFPPNVENIK